MKRKFLNLLASVLFMSLFITISTAIDDNANMLQCLFVTKAYASVIASVPGWSNITNGAWDGEVRQVSDVKHSGAGSLRLTQRNALTGNVYLLTQQWITCKQATKYKASCWIKTENANGGLNFFENSWTGQHQVPSLTGTKDWFEYTYDLTTSGVLGGGNVGLCSTILLEGKGIIWLDDFQVEEYNADGVTLSGVIIRPINYSFESNIDLVAPANVTNAQITSAQFDKLVISWTNPSDADLDRIMVYSVAEDNSQSLLKTVKKSESVNNTISVTELVPSTPYKFIIKSVDTTENVSSGIEVFGNTVDFLVDSPLFAKEGVGVIDKLQSGNIVVSIGVQNSFEQHTLPVSLILALYDGDIMVDMVLVKKDVTRTLIGQKNTIEIPFVVQNPLQANYRLQAYVWDDLYGMEAYKEKSILSIEGLTYE